MNIFFDYKDFYSHNPTVLSIGMFDGVHLGHRSIIQQMRDIANRKKLSPTLLTFHPHPRLFFNPDEHLKYLSLQEEKVEIFENLGIENIIFQTFNEDFSSMYGKEFISEVIAKKINAQHIVIGHDHLFGKNKSGNFSLLQALSSTYEYSVEQAQTAIYKGFNVSSTQVRKALLEGDIPSANAMLGTPYSLHGMVIHGKKIGRTIGFPTANIEISNEKLLPKAGAYVVKVYLDKNELLGMLSIGNNPTFNGEKTTIEVHILDFNSDIYGKNIKISFYDFLHTQIKFESVEGLIEILNEDKRRTQDFFAVNNIF